MYGVVNALVKLAFRVAQRSQRHCATYLIDSRLDPAIDLAERDHFGHLPAIGVVQLVVFTEIVDIRTTCS